MSKITVGLFSDSKQAGDAVGKLKDMGYTDKISVVAKDENQNYIDTQTHQVKDTTTNATTGGAFTGSLVGGVLGFLVGAGAVAVPGGFVVLGTLATTLIGIGGGATLGALTGALIDAGVPEEQVTIFSDRLAAGDVAVIVESSDDKAEEVEKVMKNHNVQLLEMYA